MSTFIAAYITTNGKEWDEPLCVEKTLEQCKRRFCAWYGGVNHEDCGVRYAPVTIVECKK